MLFYHFPKACHFLPSGRGCGTQSGCRITGAQCKTHLRCLPSRLVTALVSPQSWRLSFLSPKSKCYQEHGHLHHRRRRLGGLTDRLEILVTSIMDHQRSILFFLHNNENGFCFHFFPYFAFNSSQEIYGSFESIERPCRALAKRN